MKTLLKRVSYFPKSSFFFNFVEAVKQTSPTEVFSRFGQNLLQVNPQTHLTMIDMCFNIEGPGAEKFPQTAITWLNDSSKLDYYVKDVSRRLSTFPLKFRAGALKSLDRVVCAMKEMPNELSLTLIPELVKLLSCKTEDYLMPLIIVTLYGITQKTKDKDRWSNSDLEKICKHIVPCTQKEGYSSDLKMYAYALLADLSTFSCVPGYISSLGLTPVPDGLLIWGTDENLKAKLRALNRSLKRQHSVSKSASEDSKDSNLSETKKKKKKKKRKREREEDDVVVKEECVVAPVSEGREKKRKRKRAEKEVLAEDCSATTGVEQNCQDLQIVDLTTECEVVNKKWRGEVVVVEDEVEVIVVKEKKSKKDKKKKKRIDLHSL